MLLMSREFDALAGATIERPSLSPTLDRCAGRAVPVPRRVPCAGQLSGQADQARGALPARGLHGPRRAPARHGHRAAHRPAHRRRQPARRGRLDRDRGGRARRARRLHDPAAHVGDRDGSRRSRRTPPTTSSATWRPSRLPSPVRTWSWSTPSLPVKNIAELIAYAKANPGQALLRVRRTGIVRPSHRRALQAGCGHRDDARAVQGRRSVDHRAHGQRGAAAVRHAGRLACVGRERQAARARGDEPRALAGHAERADRVGKRAQGLPGGLLARHLRAGEDAAADRRQALPRAQDSRSTIRRSRRSCSSRATSRRRCRRRSSRRCWTPTSSATGR